MTTSDSAPSERAALGRFARKAALLLPVLLLVPAVNFVVDPANLFVREGAQEAQIAEQLLGGKKVVNFDRYDDRRIAKYLLEHRDGTPNVLILGSSRTLNMGSSLFPKSTVVNGSMLGGTLREVLAAYEIVHRRGLHPDTVIVGVDPWMLNADAYDDRWVAIAAEFDSALHTLGIPEWPNHKEPEENRSRLGALFSADYFQQSVKSLRNRTERPKWFPTDRALNDGFTRVPDGSYTYAEFERSESAAGVDERANKYLRGKIYLLDDNARINETLLQAIASLLELIRSDGGHPILYLPPYHPKVYSTLAADPRHAIVTEAETALRTTAARLNVPVVGSYDPARLGLAKTDFYDGHHLTEAGFVKLFAR